MINAALVTDASKAASRQTLVDYANGVFAHITGDWSQHNQARIWPQSFLDQAGNTDSVSTLRLGLTNVSGPSPYDTAVAIPCTATGTSVLANSPPIITVQPVDTTVITGSLAQFIVVAISSGQETFQWNFNGTAIPNQTSSLLVLSSAAGTNAGGYSVVVANVNGTAASRVAALSVVPPSTGSPGGGSGDDILFDVLTGWDFGFGPF